MIARVTYPRFPMTSECEDSFTCLVPARAYSCESPSQVLSLIYKLLAHSFFLSLL